MSDNPFRRADMCQHGALPDDDEPCDRCEIDRLRTALADAERERDALRAGVVRLASEWESFRWAGYVPPENGAAGEYVESAVHDCAEELRQLLPAPPQPEQEPAVKDHLTAEQQPEQEGPG